MKKLLVIFGLFIGLTSLAQLIFSTKAKAEPLDRPRYISLAPSTTEILFALGLDKEIVGVSTFCNYPPEAKLKPKVGDFSQPNLEKIVSLHPDYIFCTGLEQAPVIAELKRLNLKTYVADPVNIKGLLGTIKDIGEITQRGQEAQEIIQKMNADIAAITALTKLIPPEKKIKVFVEIWHEPLMAAGKGSFIDEMINLAGGINISHNLARPYSIFSSEKVISLNPGCIIMAYMDQETPLKLLESRFGWKNIAAVKNKRVFNDINPDILLRPGPRITEGLKEIYKKLYP